ncbi:MAG: DMT family transporter [Candidatus Curtissbacteria bacterium]
MIYSKLTPYVLLIIVAAVWGIAVPIVKVTLENFSPVTFLTYRFLITSLILVPLLLVMEKPKLTDFGKNIPLIILSGLLGSSINLGLLFWGLDNTTSLSASLLSSLTPVMAVASAVLFLKEKISGQVKTGLIVAFLGTAIFVVSSSLATTNTASTLFGDILVILANLTLVAYVVTAKKLLNIGYSPFYLVTSMFLLGFISMLPLSLVEYGSPAALLAHVASQNLNAHLGVWYMAVFSGAIGYFLYQEGQRRIGVARAIIFQYIVPLFTLPLSFLWLKEPINLTMVISILIIALGIFIAERKYQKHHLHEKTLKRLEETGQSQS